MNFYGILISLLFLIPRAITSYPSAAVDEELSKFLLQVNQKLAELYDREVLASYQNEIQGPGNLVALLQAEIASEDIMKYLKSIWPKILKFKRLGTQAESLKRQLDQIPDVGYEALTREDLHTLYKVTSNLSEIYKNIKLCSYENPNYCNLTLVPDIQNRLHSTKNLGEIEHYWLEWRRKTGVAARRDFGKFVELYRKTAKLNGFSKPSEFWFRDIDDNSTEAIAMLDKFLQDLKPLFLQFHAHVRRALRKSYGLEKVPLNKAYPQNLAEIFIGSAFHVNGPVNLPYPNISMPNITEGLLQRGLNNPARVFWNVAEYYRSLGMPSLEDNFWSERAKPKADISEEHLSCWHKTWKFYALNQILLSYCPVINEDRFLNMFEAVMEIYYYKAYEMQPTLFREEAFPNFSEALGKVFSLSASSPSFLQKLKIIDSDYNISYGGRINRLYAQGLKTVFLLPVFYVLDRYRVDVLDGKTNLTDNCSFWDLTTKYTGAEPPFKRSNEDFDAPSKFLMEIDDQYTSQIMSIVLQFQLYKHFCEISNQYVRDDPKKPLDLCDLSNQRTIGPLLNKAMSLGSSRSYKEILNILTNQSELSLDGFLEYFEPLHQWLEEDNKKQAAEVGWESSEKCQP